MVEFISYSGEYPRRCQGTLILKIDGKEVSFGDDIDDLYEPFWSSGGEIGDEKGGGYHIYRRPWNVHKEKLPKEYQEMSEEIASVMNKHMRWGCCGGCLYGRF